MALTRATAFLLTVCLLVLAAQGPAATSAAAQEIGPSGLPLPRFVSLGAGRVNMRVGPGTNYAVDWMYVKSGLPMEIIQEYGHWRRVRDSQGAEGWINQALLSGRRTGIVAPWQKGKSIDIDLLAEPVHSAKAVAIIEPGVVGEIHQCDGEWCRMVFDGHEGWIEQALIWGIYPGEVYTE